MLKDVSGFFLLYYIFGVVPGSICQWIYKMACRNSIHFLQSEVLKFSKEIEDLTLEIENLEKEINQKTNASSGYISTETPRIYWENLLSNMQSEHDSLRILHIPQILGI